MSNGLVLSTFPGIDVKPAVRASEDARMIGNLDGHLA